MNVGMIFTKVANGVKSLGGNTLLMCRKHAPEIMIGSGIVGFVATVVETIHATNETNDILDHKDERMAKIEDARETDGYSPSDYAADVAAVKHQTRWALIKTWAPVGTTGVASILLIFGGYRVINGRYVATAAAYKTLEAGFNRYRSNVIDEFGKDVDWRMQHSIKAEELEEARKEREQLANQEERQKKKGYKTAYSKNINNQIFDCNTSEYWKRYWIPHQVIEYIQTVESKLQDKLNSKGHVFLNEAYDMLGMERTTQGSIIGWINTPRNSHLEKGRFLSLGYANDECPEEEIRRILASPSNEETWAWITPNCDGVIYQLIDKPFSER